MLINGEIIQPWKGELIIKQLLTDFLSSSFNFLWKTWAIIRETKEDGEDACAGCYIPWILQEYQIFTIRCPTVFTRNVYPAVRLPFLSWIVLSLAHVQTNFTGTPPKEQTFPSHRTVYLDIHLGYLIYHMRLDYLLLLYPRLIDSFPRFYISFLWFIRC